MAFLFITAAQCAAPTLSPRYAIAMWNKPGRHYGAGDFHFITCSCYHRRPLLGTPPHRDLFLTVLEQVRRRYQFVIAGYVVMPEHIHLLVGEPQKENPSTVMQALKTRFCAASFGRGETKLQTGAAASPRLCFTTHLAEALL